MKEFSTSEAELMDLVDTLQCVIAIIQEEMTMNSVFVWKKMIDTRNMNSVMQAFTEVIDATALSSVNRQK